MEIDGALLAKATEAFEKNFDLVAGRYAAFIRAVFDNGKKRCVKGYTFTIYEQNEALMRKVVDNFKYGVDYAQKVFQSNSLPVRVEPMSDSEAARKFDSLRVS